MDLPFEGGLVYAMIIRLGKWFDDNFPPTPGRQVAAIDALVNVACFSWEPG